MGAVIDDYVSDQFTLEEWEIKPLRTTSALTKLKA